MMQTLVHLYVLGYSTPRVNQEWAVSSTVYTGALVVGLLTLLIRGRVYRRLSWSYE